ncbi:hypothetical protein [Methanothrix sp.]|uniref:ribbon-helix-helix domain-containing protein n=1 Tax=Methanothrix sp. TaxID=90426 RepID=UPI003455439D
MADSKQSKRVAVSLPEEARSLLEKEAEETGVPLSNLLSYIAVNYVWEEKITNISRGEFAPHIDHKV